MTAILSAHRNQRYRLERPVQAEGIVAAVIMVNPSDADESKNDPTITKLIGFGKKLGWRRVIVGNKFSQIAADIKNLRDTVAVPVSDAHNDRHLAEIMADGDIVVVGWGAMAKLPEILRKRWIDIVRMADGLDKKLYCLGTNDDGHPKHPLMTGYDVPLTEWQAPWFPNRGKRT